MTTTPQDIVIGLEDQQINDSAAQFIRASYPYMKMLKRSFEFSMLPIPQQIKDRMGEDIRKDIIELYDCMRKGVWTAACLMAFRLFEESLRIYASDDLRLNKAYQMKLGDLVDTTKHCFDASTTQNLHELRKLRNKITHHFNQPDEEEAIRAIHLSLAVTFAIFSIEN